MRQQLLFIGLTLFFKTALGQTIAFDRGVGNSDNLATAVTVLELITRNEPNKLYEYFSTTFKPDIASLKKECAFASTNFPFMEGSHAPCFCDNSEKELWYERTYYKETNGTTEYLFQIFIKMEKTENGVKIVNMQFRHKDKVVKREKEVKEMAKSVDDNNPPPPPPPLGLPDK